MNARKKRRFWSYTFRPSAWREPLARFAFMMTKTLACAGVFCWRIKGCESGLHAVRFGDVVGARPQSVWVRRLSANPVV